MERVVPVLGIDDYQQACEYYVKALGFRIDFEHRHEPGFPVHMGVQRGDVYLHLSEHSRGQPGSEIYIFVKDIQEWWARCRQHNLQTDGEPRKKPWGNTELTLTDPFRNTIRLSEINTHPGQSTPNKDA
ncbi:MAG: VOC family protein [Planctomycetes bacterium]|nr:VOC family protein [Planctomycetota bacterium]